MDLQGKRMEKSPGKKERPSKKKKKSLKKEGGGANIPRRIPEESRAPGPPPPPSTSSFRTGGRDREGKILSESGILPSVLLQFHRSTLSSAPGPRLNPCETREGGSNRWGRWWERRQPRREERESERSPVLIPEAPFKSALPSGTFILPICQMSSFSSQSHEAAWRQAIGSYGQWTWDFIGICRVVRQAAGVIVVELSLGAVTLVVWP
jgi:hypothetical protein